MLLEEEEVHAHPAMDVEGGRHADGSSSEALLKRASALKALLVVVTSLAWICFSSVSQYPQDTHIHIHTHAHAHTHMHII
jgi:hypothetical protein